MDVDGNGTLSAAEFRTFIQNEGCIVVMLSDCLLPVILTELGFFDSSAVTSAEYRFVRFLDDAFVIKISEQATTG